MSQSFRHKAPPIDPRRVTKTKQRLIDALQSPVATLEPAQIDAWLESEVKSMADVRRVLREVAGVVNALANERKKTDPYL